MKVQSSFWWLLLVLKFGAINAVVISEEQDMGTALSRTNSTLEVSNRFSDPALERLHVRRVALVSEVVSLSSGRLLAQSQNKISANKLNWLLDVVKSCESLTTVKAKLVDLLDHGAAVVSTGAGTSAAVSRVNRADRAREVERARWACGVVGRFRSVSDIRAEAVAELARLERLDSAEMVSPSAESRVLRRVGLSRSRSQLSLDPHSHAGFKHRAATVDWEDSVAPSTSGILVAGTAVSLTIRTSHASARGAVRPSRLSPLETLVGADVGVGMRATHRSPPASPRPQASPSRLLPASPVFRIGQLSPVSPD